MRGYTLAELMVLLVFLALVATVAARAIELPPPTTAATVAVRLTQTTRPCMDTGLGNIFDCPLSPEIGNAADCGPRGPASDVNANGDPVGADLYPSHGNAAPG